MQLALLTATVKLFIQRPTAGQELVPKVLKWATEEIDNPDLRDRGFIYWRLLSTDPAAATNIVFAEKPPISTETEAMDRGVLDRLLLHTGTLASLYGKEPQTFVRGAQAKFLQDSPALDPLAKRSNMDALVIPSAPAQSLPSPAAVASSSKSYTERPNPYSRQDSTGMAMGASAALMADELGDDEEDEDVALNPTAETETATEALASTPADDGGGAPSPPLQDNQDGAMDPYASLARMSLDFGGPGGSSNGYAYESPQPVRGNESLL